MSLLTLHQGEEKTYIEVVLGRIESRKIEAGRVGL